MTTKMERIVGALQEQYGDIETPPPANAFEHVLWEKVTYLATDERRAATFDALRKRVGLTPQAILVAKANVRRKIVASGGARLLLRRHGQDGLQSVVAEMLRMLAPQRMRVLR